MYIKKTSIQKLSWKLDPQEEKMQFPGENYDFTACQIKCKIDFFE